MKSTIEGFNQAKAIELGLDGIDLIILRYIVDFKDSGSMASRILDDELYYWINYEGVLQQLPILKMKKDTLYRRLKGMSKSNILKQKTVKRGGTYSFFNIGDKYWQLISDVVINTKEKTSDLNPKGTDLNPEQKDLGFKSVRGTDLNPEQTINLLYNNNNIYSRVVEHLNKKTDSSFKSRTIKTQGLIKARLSEGFTEEEFLKVIDNKVSEWVGTEYEKYLRPETLFGTKFESYLNQKISTKTNTKNQESTPAAYKPFEFN